MKMIASPSSRWRSSSRREHLRLHHHVERGGRLVGDQQPRLAGQRHRDQHPLPLAAGELVRVGARAARRQTHLLEQLAARASGRSRRRPSSAAGSPRAIWSPTRWTGLSVCSAPWNTIASSVQRTARRRPGFIASTSSPSSSTSPSTSVPSGAGAGARRRATTSRSPTRPRARASRPRRARCPPRARPGTGAGPSARVGHPQIPDLEQAHPRWSLSRGRGSPRARCRRG